MQHLPTEQFRSSKLLTIPTLFVICLRFTPIALWYVECNLEDSVRGETND
jgi:hypothetical protein